MVQAFLVSFMHEQIEFAQEVEVIFTPARNGGFDTIGRRRTFVMCLVV